MIEAAIKKYSRIDVLVNNAGMIRRSPAVDYSEEDWTKVIEVNLSAVFRLSQLAGRKMIKQGSGKIINIASLLSFQGGIEASNQGFPVEGLGQIADRPGLQSSRAIALDGEGGDENEWQAISPGKQVGLQVEPAHGRHSDIRDHARCVTQMRRSQELLGRRERMDGVAKRSHEVVGRCANGPIIVDD